LINGNDLENFLHRDFTKIQHPRVFRAGIVLLSKLVTFILRVVLLQLVLIQNLQIKNSVFGQNILVVLRCSHRDYLLKIGLVGFSARDIHHSAQWITNPLLSRFLGIEPVVSTQRLSRIIDQNVDSLIIIINIIHKLDGVIISEEVDLEEGKVLDPFFVVWLFEVVFVGTVDESCCGNDFAIVTKKLEASVEADLDSSTSDDRNPSCEISLLVSALFLELPTGCAKISSWMPLVFLADVAEVTRIYGFGSSEIFGPDCPKYKNR